MSRIIRCRRYTEVFTNSKFLHSPISNFKPVLSPAELTWRVHLRYLCEIDKLSDENFHRYHSTFLNSKNTIQLLPEEVPKVKEDLIRSQLLEIIKVGKLYHDPEEVIRGGLDIHELNELLDYQVRRKIIPHPSKFL